MFVSLKYRGLRKNMGNLKNGIKCKNCSCNSKHCFVPFKNIKILKNHTSQKYISVIQKIINVKSSISFKKCFNVYFKIFKAHSQK